MSDQKPVIAFPTLPQAHGGPGSFQRRFQEELRRLGWTIRHRPKLHEARPNVIFVIAGSRHLLWLLANKLRGVPIVQRLDGIEWQNKFKQGSVWHRILKPRIEELLVIFIYRFLASGVVYQSHFVESCWRERLRYRPKHTAVIYNGVNIEAYAARPDPDCAAPNAPRLLCVEGEVQSFDAGILPLIDVAKYLLQRNLISGVTVIGKISSVTRRRLQAEISCVDVMGVLSREDTKSKFYNAVYYVVEINAACPNSLIEALACGCPVLAFDTGAVSELVPPGSGEIVPYLGDPWSLDVPDPEPLRNAAEKILRNFPSYSLAARESAKTKFGVAAMTRKYLESFEVVLSLSRQR